VRDAAVRRKFPDGVEIELQAYDAVARWNDDALLSSRGEIFRAPFAGTLPRVRAPDAMAGAVVRDLALVQAAVKPIGSPISEIAVSARGAWHVVLASGLVLEAGHADVGARLERFASAWPQLAAAGTETRHADLRYANGFALRRVADVQPVPASARAVIPSTRPHKKK
jgi:cell division protein FtsQ